MAQPGQDVLKTFYKGVGVEKLQRIVEISGAQGSQADTIWRPSRWGEGIVTRTWEERKSGPVGFPRRRDDHPPVGGYILTSLSSLPQTSCWGAPLGKRAGSCIQWGQPLRTENRWTRVENRAGTSARVPHRTVLPLNYPVSPLYTQNLVQHPTLRRHAIDICWMNEDRGRYPATTHWVTNGYVLMLQALLCPSSLRPYGLQPARLLCPWDFPGKNTGEGNHLLLQGSSDSGIRPTSLLSPALAGRFFTTEPPGEP